MAERIYEAVIPLVSKPGGWGYRDIVFGHNSGIFVTGDMNNNYAPGFRNELTAAYNHTLENRPNDFNGLKAMLRFFYVNDGNLIIHTGTTDYFTLRGIPFAAPDLHRETIEDLKEWNHTDIPTGISAHTILLAGDQAVMTINTAGHGFAPGRLSLTFEGQMDPPPKDRTPFHTAQRELSEELGRKVNLGDIGLLGVAAETGSSYTSWCFIVPVQGTPETVKKSWEGAKTREASALLIAPIAELGRILLPDTQAEGLQKYVVGGSLDPEKTINPHPTVPWRYDCLKDYIVNFISS